MNSKYFLITIAVATLLGWSAFGMLISETDPASADFVIFGLFYGTLVISVFGSALLLLISFNRVFRSDTYALHPDSTKEIGIASVIAVFSALTLVLTRLGLFTWWTAAFVLIALVLLILFFSVKRVQTDPYAQ